MKVTQVKVSVIKDMPRLKGTASVVFDECFKVRDIFILPKNETGELYIGMPSKKLKNDKRLSLAYPITAEFRSVIETAVLDEYQRLIDAAPATEIEAPDDDEPAVYSEEE